MALTQISTAGVKDDAVTSGKIPANAVGTSEIADEAVTLAKLPHGTSSNDGKFLRANNGADPSFETVSIPAGTTINNNADNRLITGSGTANTLNGESTLTFDGSLLKLQVDSGEFRIESANGVDQLSVDSDNGNTFINGNVGIGTSTPTSPDGSNADNSLNGPTLAVYGDSPAINLTSSTTGASDYSLINFGRTGSSSNPYRAIIGYKQSDDILRINAQNHIAFDAGGDINASEAMRIDGSGRVGIGATSFNDAAEYLLVKNDSTASNISIVASNDAHSSLNLGDEDDFNIQKIKSDHTDNSLQLFTNNAERMRIDSSGKIIIPVGTTTRLGIADRTSGTGAGGSLLVSAGAARGSGQNTGNLLLGAGRGNDSANNGVIQFGYTDGSDGTGLDGEWMRLTSSGQLLIGTTSTTGVSSGSDDIVIGSIGDSTERGLTFATTNYAAIRWADAGDNAMGRIQYSNSTDVMTFHTSNATRLRLDADGMKFGSDSAATNALNDYETGTFTPTCNVEGQGATSLSTAKGVYVKIGNMVHVSIEVELGENPSNKTTGNAWEHGGLPFLTQNDTDSSHPGLRDYRWAMIVMQPDTGSTYGSNGHFIFRINDNGSNGRVEWQHSDLTIKNASLFMQDTAGYQFSCTYPTSL